MTTMKIVLLISLIIFFFFSCGNDEKQDDTAGDIPVLRISCDASNGEPDDCSGSPPKANGAKIYIYWRSGTCSDGTTEFVLSGISNETISCTQSPCTYYGDFTYQNGASTLSGGNYAVYAGIDTGEIWEKIDIDEPVACLDVKITRYTETQTFDDDWHNAHFADLLNFSSNN